MDEDCLFCGDIPSEVRDDLPTTQIADYDNWTVLLHFNQYYPGRCIVLLKRHIEDLFTVKTVEREELFTTVVPAVKTALDDVFAPDLFNYASLGNEVRHLHLHVIPRYRGERTVKGCIFEDERWGSNYKPYPEDFEVPRAVFAEIRERLRDAFQD